MHARCRVASAGLELGTMWILGSYLVTFNSSVEAVAPSKQVNGESRDDLSVFQDPWRLGVVA